VTLTTPRGEPPRANFFASGRVIQAVEDMGKLDNTLIIYISGDNGALAEGSPNGTPSEVMQFNGICKYFPSRYASKKGGQPSPF